ncbi:MAG TPA: hypothetical protein PKD52_10460 [Clostridiales bacterium]|nr:hypothetical protein [Clostridiales bacterium]
MDMMNLINIDTFQTLAAAGNGIFLLITVFGFAAVIALIARQLLQLVKRKKKV